MADLEDVLRGGDAVVEGGPLERVVAEAVGLRHRPALQLDEAVQLLEVPVGGARVDVVLERLLRRLRLPASTSSLLRCSSSASPPLQVAREPARPPPSTAVRAAAGDVSDIPAATSSLQS